MFPSLFKQHNRPFKLVAYSAIVSCIAAFVFALLVSGGEYLISNDANDLLNLTSLQTKDFTKAQGEGLTKSLDEKVDNYSQSSSEQGNLTEEGDAKFKQRFPRYALARLSADDLIETNNQTKKGLTESDSAGLQNSSSSVFSNTTNNYYRDWSNAGVSTGRNSINLGTYQLSPAYVGEVYCEYLNPNFGRAPYSWSLRKGMPPQGLILDAKSGMLCGTPEKVEISSFVVSITDAGEISKVATYSIVVSEKTEKKEGELKIQTASLPVAKVGADYATQLSAFGGELPYVWQVSGLADGLIFDPASGVIGGTPIKEGSYQLSVSVSDKNGSSNSSLILLSVEGSPLFITTESLSVGEVGVNYRTSLTAQGGSPPYLWQIVSGNLAEGLSFDSESGFIYGIPKAAIKSTIRFRVSDQFNNSDSAEYPISITGDELRILTLKLPEAVDGETYYTLLSASGGRAPYTWMLSSGSLPDGLFISPADGVLSGIAKVEGEFVFSLAVVDIDYAKQEQSFELVLNPKKLKIETSYELSPAVFGAAYDYKFSASGGKPPYVWQLVQGVLPEGLLFNQEGAIRGIPLEQVSELVILVSVSDSKEETSSEQFVFNSKSSGLSPIRGMYAQSSDSKVGLLWKNPEDPSFLTAAVVRGEGGFPKSPFDGNLIYSGRGFNAVDKGLINGVRYYYAAFAIYDDLSFSEATLDVSTTTAMPRELKLNTKPDPYADEVVEFKPLDAARCFNKQALPLIVLGAPQGAGLWVGSSHVVSLHSKVNNDAGQTTPYGGSITLKFSDNIIVNGAGVDFTVFENAFRIYGTDSYFVEPAVVEVSLDGETFYTFPYNFVPHYDDQGNLKLDNPFCYAKGFAGVHPVFSKGASPNPTNPNVSGGDSFDLSAIPNMPLTWIRYVRITATGDSWIKDENGDLVRHQNFEGTWAASGTGNSGFDLDAIAAVNY